VPPELAASRIECRSARGTYLEQLDMHRLIAPLAAWLLLGTGSWALADKPAEKLADLILRSGKVVTVDPKFTIHAALAVRDGRVLTMGSNEQVMATAGPKTEIVDLDGKLVLPGLIDSHTHPLDASMTEFEHEIPPMESIADVLAYIRQRAAAAQPGEWIVLRQVFITRLAEQRYPTKAELDAAAPNNPVVYSTGPDASVNTLALKASGIDRNFQPAAGGKIEHDPVTGEPTGILRSALSYVKGRAVGRKATPAEQDARLEKLFDDYNANGLTSIIDRDCSAGSIARYSRLRAADKLRVRVAISHDVSSKGKLSDIQERIREVARHPLCRPDPMLRIIGIKTYLDGGMLTGSAYMLKPWGVSQIYSIDDPRYRGLRYIEPDVLLGMVQTTVESGLQFTAHSVGDAAVQGLLDAYEEVNRTSPIAPTRPCITHSNFMTPESIAQAGRLKVALDIQPAWLYLDAKTLVAQFGYDRLRWFQPLKTIFEQGVIAGGGSDHMQKIGGLRAVNPYDPMLAMWVAVTRKSQGYPQPLHPEEALTREQAIRFYTINNAYIMFLDDQIGSLEPGKLADMVVVNRDLLACPADDIRDAKVLRTYLGGKLIYKRGQNDFNKSF
jgi:hypothetical protein